MCVFRNGLEILVVVIKKLRFLHGLPVSLKYKHVVFVTIERENVQFY